MNAEFVRLKQTPLGIILLKSLRREICYQYSRLKDGSLKLAQEAKID